MLRVHTATRETKAAFDETCRAPRAQLRPDGPCQRATIDTGTQTYPVYCRHWQPAARDNKNPTIPMQPHPAPSIKALPPALNLLAMLGFWAVVLYFAWFQFTYAVNIPHHDGIYDFLQFIVNVEQAESVRTAFAHWFAHYNDHRTNASRIQVYLAYLVEGEVNFHTLTLLANLSLAWILGIFSIALRGHPHRWLVLLASAALLLHIRVFEIVLWSQPVFAYCWVFVYAFGTFFALHNITPVRFILGCLLCTLATWTFAAGQLVWALGLFSLAHQGLTGNRKAWVYAAAWLVLAIIMESIWLADYDPIEISDFVGVDPDLRNSHFPGLVINPTLGELGYRMLSFFLVLLGAATQASSTLNALLLGAAGLALLCFLSYRQITRDDIRLLLCCWFVVGTAAAISYGRAFIAEPTLILESRYSQISIFFMCSLLLLTVTAYSFRHYGATLLVTVLSLGFCVYSYTAFEPQLVKSMNKRFDKYNNGIYEVFGAPKKEPRSIVEKAIELKIYSPPCKPQPACEDSRWNGHR